MSPRQKNFEGSEPEQYDSDEKEQESTAHEIYEGPVAERHDSDEEEQESAVNQSFTALGLYLSDDLASSAESEERQRLALKVLRECRALSEADRRSSSLVPPWREAFSGKHACGALAWQVLTRELASWLVDTCPLSGLDDRYPPPNGRETAPERQRWLHTLMLFQAPGERYQGPVALVLPWPLYRELRDGIDALADGETIPLLQPRASRRHGAAWSRDQMRLRALEHVHFLVGQGVSKGKARCSI
jgi:hypothetical protein